ncbi:MAG: UMP kinase [Methanosarcinaceae archaeon]|nr:UMP kinase [Methanosarcinaceae archaeon]
MLIVLSLGGSVLAGDLDPESFKKYANTLVEISKEHKLLVVTGGGVFARKYIELAHGVGADEVTCDFIGIEVTRLNARMLIAAIGKQAYPEIPENYKEAAIAMETGKIVVMGGVIPGQTTDAVAAAMAEYIKADMIIIPTSVDGIYDSDPNVNKSAKKYDRISPSELVALSLKSALSAGAKSPVDPIASKLIERSKIKTILIDGRKHENIKNLIENEAKGITGKCPGTIIG